MSRQAFDNSTNPPWLMMPQGGRAYVRLIDGPWLNVFATMPMIWTQESHGNVGLNERTILLHAPVAGDFAIDARSASGDLRAWLEVAVKPYKSITVAFNFVRDTAVANGKDVHQGTRRNHSEVEGMLATMNRIYAPLNVQFVQQSIRDITVPSSLGPAVDVSLKPLYRPPYQTYPTRQEWEIINDQADATANWNVFFVWKLNVYQQKGAAAIARKGGPCFFDDSVEYPGRTLAHEARHFFGLADDYSGPRHNLLYPYNGSRGEAIPRPHADLINPSGPKPKLLH